MVRYGLQYSRYAEIVNVVLGDGQIRKGQVLEIVGKRAVVQVKDFLLTYLNCQDLRGNRWYRCLEHSLRVHR